MNDKRIKEVWEKVRDAVTFRHNNKDPLWRELDAFDRGQQWALAGSMPSWIPKPSSNYIAKTKKFKTGNLILDDYLGELKPLAAEQEPQIWMLQRYYEQLWDKLNLKYHVLETIRTSRLLGTGILYVGWDEAYIGGTRHHLYQGEILVKQIEPTTFFVDPMAFDISEARYCGTFTRTTEEHIMMDPNIESKYKKRFKERETFAGNSLGGQTDRGEVYEDRNFEMYQDRAVDLVTYYEKVPRKNGGFDIQVLTIADGVLINVLEELRPNHFPFIMLRQHAQRMDFWGVSDCQLILPNVKMINKVQSIIGTLATLYQNPQKIVYEGSGIDPRIVSKYGNAFGLVFLSKYPDLANAMRNVDVQDIPQTLLAYIEFLKADIEDFTGMGQIASGQSSGSLQTAGGINSMIERSLTGDQDEFTVFEQFLEKVSYALLMNAVEYYTDDRIMRMKSEDTNNDFEFEYVPFKADEFKDIMWDFSIDIVQKIKNNDQNKRDIMQMLSEWQLQYSPDVKIVTPADIVKAFNPSNRDVILARIDSEQKQKEYDTAAQITTQVIQGIEADYDPQMLAEIVYKILNPTQADSGIGEVQKKQQGIQQ